VANTLSLGMAIDHAGTNRNTVTQWRHTIPAFNEALEQAMRDRAVVNQERIQALVWDAIAVLRDILEDKKASPSVRLRTAQTVFKIAAAGTKLEPAETPEPLAQPEGLTEDEAVTEAEAPAAQPESAPKTEIMHNRAQMPIRLAAEPGRNSLCPCGSGLKFKRCCANHLPPKSLPTAA
jgi:hypothetical protein